MRGHRTDPAQCRGYLNGIEVGVCDLTIEREVIVVNSLSPKSDPKWTYVDRLGHFHAYSDREDDGYRRYPTLKATTIEEPCDGSCGGICGGEGYTRTEYSCLICAEVIKPSLIPGPHTATVPGRYDWSAEVRGGVPPTAFDRVSFRLASPTGDTWFGVGVVTDLTLSSFDYSAKVTGVSPLGHVKLKPPPQPDPQPAAPALTGPASPG